MRPRALRPILWICLATLVTAGILVLADQVSADSHLPSPPSQGVDSETCLACHDTPGFQTELPSGEPLYLTIDSVIFNTSTHGRLGYACVQCHTDTNPFPHEPIEVQTRREFSLDLYTSCARCHQDKYDATLDSVHQKALAAGNTEAAICTDCHGMHDVGPPSVPRGNIPRTCEKCHSKIFEAYSDSVHGAALMGEGNPDVPTCIDCHGVHNVAGPSTGPFRLFSPQICAECHADPELMGRYGVSTEVFDTYVSDFHGTTVILFETITPDQETNKPVCIDCHGVHDMKKVDDPESRVIKANLLATCQKCHPDATANFPSSWLSHYQPSTEEAPLVYFVNLFYKIFIPSVIGVMLIFVVSDGVRRFTMRRRERIDD